MTISLGTGIALGLTDLQMNQGDGGCDRKWKLPILRLAKVPPSSLALAVQMGLAPRDRIEQ